jgi:uncharacterized membrane protein (DUF373 family)
MVDVGVIIALREILIGISASRSGSLDTEVSSRIVNILRVVASNDPDELTKGHAVFVLNELREAGIGLAALYTDPS